MTPLFSKHLKERMEDSHSKRKRNLLDQIQEMEETMTQRRREKIPPVLDIEQIKVRDLMTENVITVSVPGDRKDALKRMVTNRISGIVVVEKDTNKLAGIITRKDIFSNPMEEQLALIMTKNPITIHPDASIRECVKLFASKKVHRLPVTENGNLVGIITPCDLMKTIELMKISEPVMNYKEPYCVPVHEDTPLIISLHTMKINKNYALPVINKDLEVVGIITDRDIFEKTSIDTKVVESYIGITEDDKWSWEGVKTFAKMFYNLNEIELPEVKTSDVMVKNVKYLFEESSVSTAARIMKQKNYDQLPLTDANDKLTGMVTSFGILPSLLNF
ncbi:MAG TPA: CBS domain-containing protein [Thermoplasmata archaeon]|nr:CBS domain-containing protein [Thermoplasmata archaeon]